MTVYKINWMGQPLEAERPVQQSRQDRMVAETKMAEIERDQWEDSRQNDNDSVDWLNGTSEGGANERLRFLVWFPWWIMQFLIAVEAQEGEGD